jgi:hypothetical protein
MRAQRSFNVDNPTNTSIMVMIQNLTTTWFSLRPARMRALTRAARELASAEIKLSASLLI